MSRTEFDQGRFEVLCPHDGRLLIAWLTDPLGRILVDGDGKGETWSQSVVGFPHDARNVGPPLAGSEPHWRYEVRCPDCRVYSLNLTDETVRDVVDPILRSCHESATTWQESDMHALMRRVARAR